MTSWQVCCYQTSPLHKRPTYFIIIKMTVATLPVDVILGMLRKGQTGNDILDILNVIVPEQSEVQSENVTEEVTA